MWVEAKVAANKMADDVGNHSLELLEYRRADRQQLVGLMGDRGVPCVVYSSYWEAWPSDSAVEFQESAQ
jgi:hypothetical protein